MKQKLRQSNGIGEPMEAIECKPDGTVYELNAFETCFDGAIESSVINADFHGSDNYSESRESGAERIDITVLPVFNNSTATTQI